MNGEGRPLLLLAAGGHAKVLLGLLRSLQLRVIGVCDPGLVAAGERRWRDIEVLGGDDAVLRFSPQEVFLANGLGSLPGSAGRRALYERFTGQGYRFPALVHPAAIVDEGVLLADGVQVMAGAVIQADARVGENSLVNTRASVDHDCLVGNHVHLAPGVTLSGAVQIGDRGHIGAGATVIQGVRIGEDCVVGAGTVVLSDLEARHQITGQPPRAPRPHQK